MYDKKFRGFRNPYGGQLKKNYMKPRSRSPKTENSSLTLALQKVDDLENRIKKLKGGEEE